MKSGFVWIWIFKLIGLTLCQTCDIEIDDPLWPKQWYLFQNKTDSNGYDMNVLPAWESCVNGTGVTVGVVDKGVQNHTDLNINRNLNAGRGRFGKKRNNFNQDDRPTVYRNRYKVDERQRRLNQLKHGTRVAGVIAAKKNENGIIGIAFGAEIADIRIATTSVFEEFNPKLLNSDIIDVYSCSFANFHTGTKTYPLTKRQEKGFSTGTTNGRRGLGSVYVFATGNSGGDENSIFTDSCAYDRLVTNRYVISVAGIQHNLEKVPNGEQCSAMMVAAFTAKAGAKDHKIVTTDIDNTTTLYFNQNSAAAPMVSGAVALALGANPHLSYRDVMHLIVETSRNDLPVPNYRSKFFRNAANYSVSSYFGFGLLDIGSLVNRSQTWKNVPDRKDCTGKFSFNAPIQRESNYFVLKINSCNVMYTEHVEVSLKVNHQNAGQIQWVLISPYGTRSVILPGRGLDPEQNMDLTVLTVQMWGENPTGYWRLEPKARFDRRLENGTLESVKIKIHGFTCDEENVRKCLDPAKQVEGQWTKWDKWSKCSVLYGSGTKTRHRVCQSGNAVYCEGSDIQEKPCTNPCPPPPPKIFDISTWIYDPYRNAAIPTPTIPDTYYIPKDRRVHLMCTVTSSLPGAHAYWQRNGRRQRGVELVRSNLTTILSLAIQIASETDEGKYRCIATNSGGMEGSSDITIRLPTPPKVTVGQTTYIIPFKRQLTLECYVSAVPPVEEVYWMKFVDGKETHIYSDTDSKKYGGSTTRIPSLSILNATRSDEGTYKCFATSPAGTGQSPAITLKATVCNMILYHRPCIKQKPTYKWYFWYGRCVSYYGCGGNNENGFNTEDDCKATCG